MFCDAGDGVKPNSLPHICPAFAGIKFEIEDGDSEMRAFFKWGVTAAVLGLMLAAGGMAQAGGKAFKVCADPNNPPFSVKDGAGYENKIAELFAAELGQPLEYTWFAQRLAFIRNTLNA